MVFVHFVLIKKPSPTVVFEVGRTAGGWLRGLSNRGAPPQCHPNPSHEVIRPPETYGHLLPSGVEAPYEQPRTYELPRTSLQPLFAAMSIAEPQPAAWKNELPIGEAIVRLGEKFTDTRWEHLLWADQGAQGGGPVCQVLGPSLHGGFDIIYVLCSSWRKAEVPALSYWIVQLVESSL